MEESLGSWLRATLDEVITKKALISGGLWVLLHPVGR